jgi:hypothetical protein
LITGELKREKKLGWYWFVAVYLSHQARDKKLAWREWGRRTKALKSLGKQNAGIQLPVLSITSSLKILQSDQPTAIFG